MHDTKMTGIQQTLFELQDEKYKMFIYGLIPTVDRARIIGVRTPKLRKLADKLAAEPDINLFLCSVPHTYFEENNLHAFLLEGIRDYEECIAGVEAFLPYVDNWATCDQMTPKIFKKHLPELLGNIQQWLVSDHIYTVRFAVRMLMCFYLEEHYSTEYTDMAASVRSEEYYVRMMVAWYFATALAKQYEAVLPYIENHCLETWTHNKAIQKAIESRRITEEQKNYLRRLKI